MILCCLIYFGLNVLLWFCCVVVIVTLLFVVMTARCYGTRSAGRCWDEYGSYDTSNAGPGKSVQMGNTFINEKTHLGNIFSFCLWQLVNLLI